MLIHPQIDPVALQIGPLAIHWYGLTYLAAFGLFKLLAFRRLRHEPFASNPAWSRRDVEDMLFLGVLGVVIGGRLGYCLFYKPEFYLAHPLKIFAVWEGGMSFHGGMLGVFAAMLWFARSRKRPWLEVTDFAAPCVPLGLAAGRVGNFINGELWGRLADPSLPWAMVFRGAGPLPRHPSHVYQFLLEGVLAVRAAVALCAGQRAGWPRPQDRTDQRRFFGGLWCIQLRCGVFPGAGCVSRRAVTGAVHGSVVEPSDDGRRRCPLGVGRVASYGGCAAKLDVKM